MSKIDEQIDGILESEAWSDTLEEHLDSHPLPVDEEQVRAIAERVTARIAPRRSTPLWPFGVGLVAAAALAFAMIGRQPVAEPNPVVTSLPVDLSVDRVAPRRWTAGTHVLSIGELRLDEDTVVWASRKDGHEALFVESGRLVLPDGTVLVAHSSWLDGHPQDRTSPASSDLLRELRLASLHRQSQGAPMLLHLVASLAATPSTLSNSVQAAQDRLEACEASPCADSEKAIATYVVAVGNYVATGTIPTETADVLYRLDPDLHATLPISMPVRAATVASKPPADEPEELRPIPPVLIAHREYDGPTTRQKPRYVEITVQTKDGHVIPEATIVPRDEYGRHPVNVETGTWKESVFYQQDGSEFVIQGDSTYDFDIYAPGFRPYFLSVRTAKRRKTTQHTVQLTPFNLTSDDAQVAWNAHQAWSEQSNDDRREGRFARPGGPPLAKTEAARQLAILEARRWMRDGGGRDAEELCLVAGGFDACGLTPPTPKDAFLGIDASIVERTVAAAEKRGDFAHCSPRKGWVQLQFSMRPSSNPVNLKTVKSSLAHLAGENCVIEQFSKLKFGWNDTNGYALSRVTVHVDAADAQD